MVSSSLSTNHQYTTAPVLFLDLFSLVFRIGVGDLWPTGLRPLFLALLRIFFREMYLSVFPLVPRLSMRSWYRKDILKRGSSSWGYDSDDRRCFWDRIRAID